MVTDQAIEFIKRWECNGTPVLTSYWDHQQHSIGYGTRAEGPNITITEEEAEHVKRYMNMLEHHSPFRKV